MPNTINVPSTYETTKIHSTQPNVFARDVWVVVKVWRGLPVLAEVYDGQAKAIQRSNLLLEACNPLDDEVAVFETKVNIPQEDI